MEEENRQHERPADRIRRLAQFYIDRKVFRGMKTFEDACHLSRFYVKNICATRHGNPGVDTIVKIYRAFEGTSLHWLVLGEGDMFTISEKEAVRKAKDAVADLKKEDKVRSVLNNKLLKGMTREEKLELMERVLNSES